MKKLDIRTVVPKTLKMPGVDGINWYSGKGQDSYIQRVFDIIGTTNKFCIEFGGGDGFNASNTLYLALNGWNRLMFDLGHHNPDINLHEINLTVDNICDTFSKFRVPSEFDFVSIDVDGSDYWLMDAMLKKYSPRCIMIEVNTRFEPYDSMVMKYNKNYVWDGHSWYGASPYAIKKLGEKYGYITVWIHQDDAILVRKDCLHPEEVKIPWTDIYPTSLKSIYAGTDPNMVLESWEKI